ncbi:MAG: hypothetical protein V7459_13105 [Oceanicoccus sp.]
MMRRRLRCWGFSFAIVLALGGCAIESGIQPQKDQGKIICDSYLVLDMCVRDYLDDGIVDMIYFSDTDEIFMYREGMKDFVASVMPLHLCAVPLSDGMQAITNRILDRQDLSLSSEIDIARQLIANYMAAKPEIDACHARHAKKGDVYSPAEDEFFDGDDEWDDEWADELDQASDQ